MQVVIHLDRFEINLKAINQRFSKPFFLVVKNNAYNFGLEKTVTKALSCGVTHFCVTTVEDALVIRRINNDCYILVMRPLNSDELNLAREHKLATIISGFSWFNQNKDNLFNIDLHLKVNVGMNRFGIAELAELEMLMIQAKQSEIDVIGLMTHFPVSDEEDLTLHNSNVEMFSDIYQTLTHLGHEFKYVHAENSATLFLQDERLDFCNYARIGIVAFGYSPLDHVEWLQPCLSVNAEVLQIRTIESNEHLGYGTQFIAGSQIDVAILDIGYGDGLIRQRTSLPVYLKGTPFSFAGRISMSHCYLQVDGKAISIGDQVEIFGDHVRVDTLMRKLTGVANSEIISMLHTSNAIYKE